MTDLVAVQDAFVAYPSPAGTVMALRGLDLTVNPGERLLVQGPNGSGKSTLLRLLTGEQAVTAGRVRVAGTDLTALPSSARRRWRASSVGMVDQHARRALLPEWRVVENVALQLRIAGMTDRDAFRRAGETLDRLGLGDLGDRAVPTLSGGEAQRVAICAALAHDPALILADEPTGELDEAAAHAVYRLLAEAGRSHGAALILVSHDRRASEAVDRAIRIRDGRVAEQWYPAISSQESQVLDDRGWLRLPAQLTRRLGPNTVRAEPLPDSAIRLVPDYRPLSSANAAEQPVVPGDEQVRVLREQVAVLPPPVASDVPALEFTGVTVRFGQRRVFEELDLCVQVGERMVLRGPSGCGKSTLISLAGGLSDPTAGIVRLGGVAWGPLDRAARAELRRSQVAVSLQSTILAEALTVAENLRLAARLRALTPDDQVEDALADLARQLGLTPLLAQPVQLLSGGERQRVAVARCLVSGARLMLLDEPTSQQDEASAIRVTAAITAATDAGRTVLAASHDPVFLAAASRVLDLSLLGAQRVPV